MNILLLIGGLILILLGANGLTDGAASVAKRFRIPSIVIGLTIVAFGTSAPELTVSVASALKGSADIAIGNVVGSNIFNTLMIVGCTALFAPIIITRNTLRKEIPLCILSSVVLLICANDIFLDNATENILNRVDGLLLLCFFAIFMGYTFAIAFQNLPLHRNRQHRNTRHRKKRSSCFRGGNPFSISLADWRHSSMEVSCSSTELQGLPAAWESANPLSD